MNRRIACLIWLVLLPLLFVPLHIRAETPVLADDQSIVILLKGIKQEENMIDLDLICLNLERSEQLIRFLLPQINGVDTFFSNQWIGEELLLLAGQETTKHLQIVKDLPETESTTLSFRVSWKGKLSVPVVIDLEKLENTQIITFDEQEPSAVSIDISSNFSNSPESILIFDQITEKEKSKLESGQAWICIKKESGLLPFCRISLQVNDEGEASAMFAGVAFVPKENPDLPIAVSQEYKDGKIVFRSEKIELTGPSIFYAAMKLSISQKSDASYAITEQTFISDELGGSYPMVPLALVDRAESILQVKEDATTTGETQSVLSSFISLDQPLSLAVCDALSLGRIRIFCEYFFYDGSSLVHFVSTPEEY